MIHIKSLLVVVILSIGVAESQAGESNARHILSIADDGALSYRYMLTDALGASFGYYQSDRKRSNDIGQSYTRSLESHALAVRVNFNPNDTLRHFFELSIRRGSVEYVGATSEDYDDSRKFITYGMEYMLGLHFSVEGMFGFGDYETTFESEKETGHFGPTTILAVNYLF